MSKPQPLNYTPKAIADLRSHACTGMPITRGVFHWIADLLEQAQVFQLPDCGELLDRSRPKPEVPGLMFEPPFPVVACEYLAQRPQRHDDYYTAVPCSRRIALAWEWTGAPLGPLGLVPELQQMKPGVTVLSVFYVDSQQHWICTGGALHFAYDEEWTALTPELAAPFVSAMIERGDMSPSLLKGKGLAASFVPLCIEFLSEAKRRLGSQDAVVDSVRADNNDEVNAYFDLCYALACKNVSAERHTASQVLNRERRRKGRPELKDFHILNLGDGDGGQAPFVNDRSGPRSHLRRGHIRRLPTGRITWINQTMVHGREGFVDKTYRMKGIG